MQFHPALDPEDFSFKNTIVPEPYLVGKPHNFTENLTVEAIIQLLDEAAAQDDVSPIWKIWKSSVTPSSWQQTNAKFPSILLATCRIVDEEGEIGSQWYNLGVVHTQTYKCAGLFAEGLGTDFYQCDKWVDKAEKLNPEEIFAAHRQDCYLEEGRVRGLVAYHKSYIDKRRKLYKEL